MINTSRALSCPAKNNAATWGSRFRVRLRCICPEALRWLTVSAAATSAAAQSQPSHAQSARWSLPVRRLVSSAIADRRRAPAATSARAQSSIAASSAASSASRSSTGSDNDISNIRSSIAVCTDHVDSLIMRAYGGAS
ncbi:Uncharacterised protein [Mycobacterium tuberculosis]|nr:hypothetical protein TM57_16510 [Mycobacterium tuberculosis]KEP56722.1 hypothetical protein HA35_14010 [Mycobacterium tuberculosis str. Beijing/DS6701]KLL08151.1 hypothetical protein ABI38_06560 [Mycobacterium tuberculosis]RYD08755.1 hypothetical protein TH64_13605 [Mycobacterium tuberculosis]CEZ93280.1 Uncharacterised protein [Mycobacterium tuberculosis]